jgi:hypothetical protein
LIFGHEAGASFLVLAFAGCGSLGSGDSAHARSGSIKHAGSTPNAGTPVLLAREPDRRSEHARAADAALAQLTTQLGGKWDDVDEVQAQELGVWLESTQVLVDEPRAAGDAPARRANVSARTAVPAT